jgi:thiamine pyrophosphate-dependent acetolactate synthase large subunit-like protein
VSSALIPHRCRGPWRSRYALQLGSRGACVIVIPGDIALRAAATEVKPKPAGLVPKPPVVVPADAELDARADPLSGDGRVTIFCGSGCAGARAEVVALAEKLKAPVGHALKGKEYVEYDNPYDVGMTGLIGFASDPVRAASMGDEGNCWYTTGSVVVFILDSARGADARPWY